MEKSDKYGINDFDYKKASSSKDNDTDSSVQRNDCVKRFDYLLKQSKMFAHFMNLNKNKNGSVSDGVTKKGKSNNLNNGASTKFRYLQLKEENEELLDKSVDECITQFEKSPFYIKNGQLRDYQIRGLNWMISLYENGINGILADEMGLGKTLQTISLLGYMKYYKDIYGPHLVIAPKSTLRNWTNEFKKWCPAIQIICFNGNKDERRKFINETIKPGNWDVCITSYEMVLFEKSVLRKIHWRYLVVDEAQRIKNDKAILLKILRTFEVEKRLLLTGTPLQNNLHELWSLLNFLLPDVFNSSDDFDEWFSMKNCFKDDTIVARLHTVLKPFLLRRLKSDVEKSLKPKKEYKIYVRPSKFQVEWYKKILLKDIDIVNGLGNVSKMRLLYLLMHLRKCCNHPYLIKGAEPGSPYIEGEHIVYNCGKMIVFDKLLKAMNKQGSRVLVFSQMTSMMDILEDYFDLRGYKYFRLDGSTSLNDRQQRIDKFNESNNDTFIFLISTRAGGLGINLASADVVILYDTDWNPQVDLQAIDRAHRIGQKKQVRVFQLVTENTVEEKIVEKAEIKLKLDKVVIQQCRKADGQKNSLKKLDMLEIIKHGANYIYESKDFEIENEDIETILRKAEEKTEEINNKLGGLKESELRNWTLDTYSVNLFQFEGKNYKDIAKQITAESIIDLPKRDRNTNINYSTTVGTKHKIRRPSPNQPKFKDFHFIPSRLSDLFDKEIIYYQKTFGYKMPNDKDPNVIVYASEIKKKTNKKKAQPLTVKEQAEKAFLLKKSFIDWTKQDFQQFISAIVKYGRDDIENISKEVYAINPEIVKKYNEVFWKRCNELQNVDEIMKIINRKEAEIKLRVVKKIFDAKIAMYEDPFFQLCISSSAKSESYTEEIDRFLICTLHKLSFCTENVYEELKLAIRCAPQFRFDMFIKSRSATDLKNRCEYLLSCIEKEFEEAENKDLLKLPSYKETKILKRRFDEDTKDSSSSSEFFSKSSVPKTKKSKLDKN